MIFTSNIKKIVGTVMVFFPKGFQLDTGTHPTPYTLHPTPYTMHPTPYTLHPAPYTPHDPLRT